MSNVEKKYPKEDSDIPFVYACWNGDIDAFGVLVERHQKNMFNLAYRIIGDYDAASDIVQEAFLSAYKAIRKYRGESSFSTWLCRIVINVSKNHLKHRKHQLFRERVPVGIPEEKGGQFWDDPPDPDPPPSEQIEKKEVQVKVQASINALDPEYKEILVLRDIQGFSYGEISEILKLPDGTVKSRLYRAREALKDRLKMVFGEL